MRQLGTSVRQIPRSALTPTQAQAMRTLQSQKRVTAYPYYSTVTFELDAIGEGGGPWTYSIARGEERRAFSYGKGEQMVNAGAPTTVATPVDTNLVQGAETISGENVEIHGIGIMCKQSGLVSQEPLNPALLAALMSHVSVDLSLNGDQNRFHLGCLAQMPGAGGLTGAAKDLTGGLVQGGFDQQMPFANNGWATRSNFFRMPEGLIWRNKGKADSQLNVIFRVERDINVYSGGGVTNNSNGLNLVMDLGVGTVGYNYPEKIEATFLVHMMGRVVGERTRSA